MDFHQTQNIVAKDDHDFRVVNCGRQWGKTTLAVWEMIACGYKQKDRKIAYFATTFDQARNIAWEMLKDIARPLMAKSPNETRLEIYIRTQDNGISEISLRGFENVETARGQQFDFLVIDEIAHMRNWKYAWESVLAPTLGFRHGKALFISTPRGFNHFYDMWKLGQEGNPQWKSWTFTTYENPFFPTDRLEQAKVGNTVDFFNQEYLAMFTRFTGLVFKEFDQNTHVGYFDHTFGQYGEYLYGLDFAVRGFTALILATLRTDGIWRILDTYKEEGEVASVHIPVMKDRMKQYAEFDKYIGYADPAGFMKNQMKNGMIWSIANEYQDAGFSIVPANNEVQAGINYVRQLFNDNKILIHPRCTKLIDEILQYQWKDQPERQVGQIEAPEKPRKVNDHLVDALRYMVFSKPSVPAEEDNRPAFPIKFELKMDKEEEGDKFTPVQFPSVYDS